MTTLSIRTTLDSIRTRLTPRRSSQAIELRAADGTPLATFGGTWNNLLERYEPTAPAPHVMQATPAQNGAAQRFAKVCAAIDAGDENRPALELYADSRRGGKTFFMVWAVLLFLLRYPRTAGQATIGWIVVPNYPRQREIHQTIKKIIPPAWLREWTYIKSERKYILPTGAVLFIKSGDDAAALKEGGVRIVGVNEAQQIEGVGIIHCAGNVIDAGGLVLCALNPPERAIGLWAMNLHEAIEAGRIKYGRITPFPPDGNPHVNQAARGRFAEIAEVIDPKQAQRDTLGLWVAIQDICYPFWSHERNCRDVGPAEWEDCTADINALTGALDKGKRREWGVGLDFQGRPSCAAVRAKAYRSRVTGMVVYVIREEIFNDIEAGQWWHEEMLCKEMVKRGWAPETCLVIGDGTGNRQGATGQQRGIEAEPSTFSFPIVRSFGYEIHAPIERSEWVTAKGKPSRIELFCRNPDVPVRLNLVNELLEQGRLWVVPACVQTATSFRKCEATPAKKPTGHWSHLSDAAGYLLYRWETARRDAGK